MSHFSKIMLAFAFTLYCGAAMAQDPTPALPQNQINTSGAAQRGAATGSRMIASSHYITNNGVLTALDSQRFLYPGTSTNVYSQQLTYQNSGSGLAHYLKYDYTYNASGKLTYMNMHRWNSGTSAYDSQGHTTFTLNGAGATTMSYSKLWISSSNAFRDNTKSSYMLNSGNKITDEIYQNWDAGSNALLNHFHYAYTLNAQGNILQLLKQDWDASIHWYNDYRTTYTYDASGQHVTGYSGEQWNINTAAWFNVYKSQRTLNSAGNPTTELYQMWNTTTSAYVPNERITYTYDAAGNNTLVTHESWNATTSAYQNATQNVYTYNSNNQLTSSINLYWSGTAFANGSSTARFNYYYEPYTTSSTGISNVAAGLKVAVYPTLCSTRLFVANGEAALDYAIVSCYGSLISKGTLQPGSNAIETSDLAAGMYILQLNAGDRKSICRFTKQ